eukprot:333855-Pyramimonas_sp.AAC.1
MLACSYSHIEYCTHTIDCLPCSAARTKGACRTRVPPMAEATTSTRTAPSQELSRDRPSQHSYGPVAKCS